MANSTTNLDTISSTQAQKEVAVNELLDAASPSAALGRHASACSGLVWAYYGGTILVGDTPTQISNGTVTLTGSDTNYVYVDSSGDVVCTTSAPASWPGPLAGDAIALYEIVTGSATVTSYTDYRLAAATRGPAGPTGPEGPPGSGGVGSGSYVYLDRVTTASSASTITFSTISGSYSSLKIIIIGRDKSSSVADSNVRMKLNSDSTASNYTNSQYLAGVGSTAAAGTVAPSTDGAVVANIPGSSGNAAAVGMAEIWVHGYTGTTFDKVIRGNAAGWHTALFAADYVFTWKSTSAITDIVLKAGTTAFVDGTVATLYGIE